ncbi:MAG: polyamine aminopropyltransferase, partial [Spongiibacteraceae bacterium]|nr:polyamine aminopropyltransferase [Spongiibacteraceae bacterium]
MSENTALREKNTLWQHDVVLIGIMAALAACGLIYEYLLAHYASRVMGAYETTIFAMIGIMIVSMGIGAFSAKWISCPFKGFAWLEMAIGFLGGISVLVMAGAVALTFTLPAWLQSTYGLHPSITTDGSIVVSLKKMADYLPFVMGFFLGVMIGMEIPLIARIRQQVHEQTLEHNTGTIYGADYIGAGVGAAIWVLVCLKIPIVLAAVGTAAVNVVAGIIFLCVYNKHLPKVRVLWLGHACLLLVLVVMGISGSTWMNNMNQALFKDTIVYSKQTPYQQLVITERVVGAGLPPVVSLNINGRLQFSSNDEHIYHSFLTYPAMLASARHQRVLVIGGGDGLALRDVLRWGPNQVVLIDLDQAMTELFNGKDTQLPARVKKQLLALNENALNDPRVQIINGDAFNEVERLVAKQSYFDTIIVDLPDPSHPDLNKLYSDYFYARLKQLLSADGAIAIQSTSPYHSSDAFFSIGKTLAAVGFTMEQYHANVPSFGEWGW